MDPERLTAGPWCPGASQKSLYFFPAIIALVIRHSMSSSAARAKIDDYAVLKIG
jgi:hypothetical protein